MTYLVCSGNAIKNNSYTVSYGPQSGRKACYTNRSYKTKGKWYYEVTHASGTGKGFLAVWASNNNYNFGVYSYRTSSGSFRTYYWSEDKSVNISSVDLETSGFALGDTFGIGFDMNHKIMYFRYKDSIKMINVETTRSNFRPYIFEETATSYKEDTIKVTFDPKQFKYSLPEGYLPWGFQFNTARQTNMIQLNIMLLIFILVSPRFLKKN